VKDPMGGMLGSRSVASNIHSAASLSYEMDQKEGLVAGCL